MSIGKVAGGVGKGIFKGIGVWFKYGFFLFFLAFLLIHAITLGIQQKDLGVTIKELAGEFLNPLVEASESIKTVNTEETLGIWKNILNYWSIYYNLYIVFLWLKLLAWGFGRSPFSNESEVFRNILLGLITFYVIQIIYILVSGQNINTPFVATWDIIKGLIDMIANTDLSGLKNTMQPNNTCVGDICII